MSKLKSRPISHFSRRNTRYHIPKESLPLHECYEEVLTMEYNDKTKRVEQKAIVQKVNPYKRNEYRCSDFAIENLTAAGVKLTPTTLMGDVSTSIENMESTLENIANDLNN